MGKLPAHMFVDKFLTFLLKRSGADYYPLILFFQQNILILIFMAFLPEYLLVKRVHPILNREQKRSGMHLLLQKPQEVP